jgi:hypothetical protein
LLSLDGIAEAPDSFFGCDDAVDAKIPEPIATQDAVILGRRCYNEWAQFRPSSQIEPFATSPIQLESIRSEISPTGYLIVDNRHIREGSANEPASAPRGSGGRRISS